MNFFEQAAVALDCEGVKSRVNDDTPFVPITSDLEVQFVIIGEDIPAVGVYVAAVGVDNEDDEFEAVLVSAVLSVEDAVAAVAHHVATDQIVGLLRTLFDGDDDCIADLESEQDPGEAALVIPEVGTSSLVRVLVTTYNGEPNTHVHFITQDTNSDDTVDQVTAELWNSDTETVLTDDDHRKMLADLYSDIQALRDEVLTLNTSKDFDKPTGVLALVVDHAEEWGGQLAPVGDGYTEYIYSDYITSLDEDDGDENDGDLYDDDGYNDEDDEEGDDNEQPHCDSAVISAKPLMGEKERTHQDTAAAVRPQCQSSYNDARGA